MLFLACLRMCVCMTNYVTVYVAAFQGVLCPNEAEFCCYDILLHLTEGNVRKWVCSFCVLKPASELWIVPTQQSERLLCKNAGLCSSQVCHLLRPGSGRKQLCPLLQACQVNEYSTYTISVHCSIGPGVQNVCREAEYLPACILYRYFNQVYIPNTCWCMFCAVLYIF